MNMRMEPEVLFARVGTSLYDVLMSMGSDMGDICGGDRDEVVGLVVCHCK